MWKASESIITVVALACLHRLFLHSAPRHLLHSFFRPDGPTFGVCGPWQVRVLAQLFVLSLVLLNKSSTVRR